MLHHTEAVVAGIDGMSQESLLLPATYIAKCCGGSARNP